MAAHKGNKYWTFRNKHGRDHKYTPEGLWEEFVNYAEWLESNPLCEAVLVPKGIKTKDENGKEKIIHKTAMPKMRAMTLTGFCVFADIDLRTYEKYRKQENYIRVISRIDNIVRTQKFEGAAAGMLNPNIIARDLGLSDKQEVDVSSNNIDLSKLSDAVIKELMNATGK